jgi:hypothetical protein
MASRDPNRHVYDVFARFQRTERPIHIGSLCASDADDARVLSRYVFDERRWLEMIAVCRADIAPLPISRTIQGRLLLLGRRSALESLTVLATIAGADDGEPLDRSLDAYRSEWTNLALVPAERALWVRTRGERRSPRGA